MHLITTLHSLQLMLSHPPPFTLTSSLFTHTLHPSSSHPHTSLSHPPPFTLLSSHPHTPHSHTLHPSPSYPHILTLLTLTPSTLHPHILTSSHTSLSHPPPSHSRSVHVPLLLSRVRPSGSLRSQCIHELRTLLIHLAHRVRMSYK